MPATGKGVRKSKIQGFVLGFPPSPAQTPGLALGTMLAHAVECFIQRISGLQPCPSRAQGHSRPIYYCHTNAKELFLLLAILENQEMTNRPAENAKGLLSAAHHFLIPEQFTHSWLLRVLSSMSEPQRALETARARQQSCWAALVMLCFSWDLLPRPLTKGRTGIHSAAHLSLPPMGTPAIAADLQANWQGSFPRQRET